MGDLLICSLGKEEEHKNVPGHFLPEASGLLGLEFTHWLRTMSGAKYKYSLVTFWKERQPSENTIRFIHEYWMRVIWSVM